MNGNGRQIRLLIVDDEEEFLLSSSRALGRRGFDVDVAPDGATALERVRQNQYDALVLDVKMPGIDGIEVFRQIHRSQPSLPVILLTGHSSVGDAFQTLKEGIADYLSKPVDMEELAQRIHEVVRAAESLEKEVSDQPPTAAGEPIRVMLVDDERELLDSLKKIFERRGMEVTTATRGREALALLREALVDVLVLDVKMPEMDGLEVLRRIKKDFPSVQVILLSGHPSVEDALEGVRMGASEYLKKPPDVNELVETIRKLYRERIRIQLEQQQRLIDEIQSRYPE